MSLEVGLLAGGIALGLAPFVPRLWHARSRASAAAGVMLWLALSAASAWTLGTVRQPPIAETAIPYRPIEVAADEYVSSRTCQACHPRNYATWHASYHRTMTQVAGPTAVVAPFNDIRLDLHGRKYQLQRRGDEFWVEMDDPDWTADASRAGETGQPPRVQRRIVMTTGSHHLQVYWYATGRGRKIEQLPFDYRIDEQRWIPDHSSFVRPPWPEGEKLPVAAPGQWDLGCIQCHATHGQPRLNVEDEKNPDTHVAEFGISCEACHGPAEHHVSVNRNPQRRYRFRRSGEPDPTIVQPARLSSRVSSQVCGQCHGIFSVNDAEGFHEWDRHGYPYRPGDELTKTRHVVRGTDDMSLPAMQQMLLHDPGYRLEDSFWSDGMVRVSGREYNGLIETPCYQRGELSCFSCHSMHKSVDDPRSLREWADDQLAPGMNGNQACLQCHTSFSSKVEDHTHHSRVSSGSQCYNCHMPYTTYGLHKAIRSHQVDSPSVLASVQTGRPNACNQCHLDKTLSWTAEHLERWYAVPQPELSDDERAVAASLLWTLRGDAGQRALMAWSMGWEAAREAAGSGWMGVFLGQLLDDPYDAVRFIAYRSLHTLPGYEEFTYDFVGPAEQRHAAAVRAGQMWMRSKTGRPTGEPILISPDGKLRVDVIQRLQQQRDDRPIMLRE